MRGHTTTQAELAIKNLNTTNLDENVKQAVLNFWWTDNFNQNVESVTGDKNIYSVWWADNFNQNVESVTGHKNIDFTNITKFSEQGEMCC